MPMTMTPNLRLMNATLGSSINTVTPLSPIEFVYAIVLDVIVKLGWSMVIMTVGMTVNAVVNVKMYCPVVVYVVDKNPYDPDNIDTDIALVGSKRPNNMRGLPALDPAIELLDRIWAPIEV